MTARYRRVPQADPEVEESKKIRAERIERITAKIHAFFWILASIGIIYFTDLPNLVYSAEINRYDDRTSILCLYITTLFFRYALNLAVIFIVANIGIFLYLTVWLPLVLKVTAPWDIYCPNMIPISTGLVVSSMILLMITFWPVWGLLAPLYITVMVIGLVFTAHFIPWPC